MKSNIVQFPVNHIVFRGRISPIVRVKSIRQDQLQALIKRGFVVLIETQSGFFSRLI